MLIHSRGCYTPGAVTLQGLLHSRGCYNPQYIVIFIFDRLASMNRQSPILPQLINIDLLIAVFASFFAAHLQHSSCWSAVLCISVLCLERWVEVECLQVSACVMLQPHLKCIGKNLIDSYLWLILINIINIFLC